MNSTDKIVTALTPGSIFNRNAHVFRSIMTLAQFAEMDEGDVLDILNGDLSGTVTCKPSAKGKGILVALTANVPQLEVGEPIHVTAGPVSPALDEEVEVTEVGAEGPLDDAPVANAEAVVGEDIPQE